MKFFAKIFAAVILAFVSFACTKPGTADFDVQFAVPGTVSINFNDTEMEFRVMFSKAPLQSDVVILGDPTGKLHTCAITSVSPKSFKIALYDNLVSGVHNVYIQRGSQKKFVGSMEVFVTYTNTDAGDIKVEEGNNVYGLVSCGGKGIPGVVVSDGYEVVMTDKSIVYVDSPAKMPERQKIKEIKEPYIKTNIFVPSEYIGPIMELCQNKRGNYVSMEYIDQTRVNIHYEIPLSEIVYDFFDKLKSYTKGYASFDYELIGYKPSNLVKMDILLNGDIVDALSLIVHKDFAYNRGKAIVENLRKLIPRQQFEIPIQAVIGTKAIARSDIKAVRKNVLAKCYGGDVSRKRKLLEKQKEGKKRMKMVGSVEVPQEAFLAVLSMEED